MIPKQNVEQITELEIRALIDAQTPEGRTLEYKRELPDSSDSGKVKFLRIVTSFANTVGGDLIYGIDAPNGVPRTIAPLDSSLIDESILRLESLIANSVDTRMSGLAFRPVPLAGGGCVLLVRVSQSWYSPHRVTVGNHAHFYGRNSAGSYQLDVSELRRAFSFSESIAERVRSFRSERLLMVGAGSTPVPLVDGPKVVFNLMPLSAFTARTQISVVPDSDEMRSFSPPGSNVWSYRMNLDGRLSYTSSGDGKSRAYAQVYRNGIVEAVFVVENYNDGKFIQRWYEEWVVDSANRYMESLGRMGVVAPIYAGLAFLGVSGYRLHPGSRIFLEEHPADRDALVIPEVQVDDMRQPASVFMKQSFDTLWNAFGYPRSFNYDRDGNWAPPK